MSSNRNYLNYEMINFDGNRILCKADEPKDGYEYIIVKVAFSLLSKETEGSVSADKYDFDFYSSNNEEYESVFVVKEGFVGYKFIPWWKL